MAAWWNEKIMALLMLASCAAGVVQERNGVVQQRNGDGRERSGGDRG